MSALFTDNRKEREKDETVKGKLNKKKIPMERTPVANESEGRRRVMDKAQFLFVFD